MLTPFTVVVEANGAHYEYAAETEFDAQLMVDQIRDEHDFHGRQLDGAYIVVDCDIHEYSFVFAGMCEACYDEDLRRQADLHLAA